jgi:hypothetical protein
VTVSELTYQVRRWFRWSEWRWQYRRFVGFFQRGWRGWADHDVWGLDHYISGVLMHSLRHLANTTHGMPIEFTERRGYSYDPETGVETPGDNAAAFEDWRAWLLAKANWFEWYHYDEDGTSDDKGWIKNGLSEEEIKFRIDAHMKKMKQFHDEVLPDFVKYWGNLWD